MATPGRGFIETSLRQMLLFFKDALWAEASARRPGWLQALDPRFKVISVILLLLAVMLSQRLDVLLGAYALVWVLALGSGFSPWFFFTRTWLFVPVFAGVMAIPALFQTFSPGEPWHTFSFLHITLVITKSGMLSAGTFCLRVLDSVSLAVLLTLTTPLASLLKALRWLRVPQMFVMTMGMSVRYIYLLVEQVQQFYLALKSRTGQVTSSSVGQKTVAWNVVGLWQRSYHMHDQVYSAMLARGFSGEPRTLDVFKTRIRDWAVLILALGAVGGSVWLNGFLK